MSYNTQSGEQIEIANSDIQAYIEIIPSEQVIYTHFWKVGWADWKPLSQIPEFIKLLPPVAAPPLPPRARAMPPPMPIRSVIDLTPGEGLEGKELLQNERGIIHLPTEMTAVSSNKSGGHAEERRMSVRHRVKLKVLVIVDNLVFRTFTTDASSNGVRLEHTLPAALVGNEVELYFSSPNSKSGLRFTATLIADQHELTRFQFSSANPQTQNIFESWLKTIPALSEAA